MSKGEAVANLLCCFVVGILAGSGIGFTITYDHYAKGIPHMAAKSGLEIVNCNFCDRRYFETPGVKPVCNDCEKLISELGE